MDGGRQKSRKGDGSLEWPSNGCSYYFYMATRGVPYGTVEISQIKTRPSLKLVQIIRITLLECFQNRFCSFIFLCSLSQENKQWYGILI